MEETLENGSIYVDKHLQTCFGQRFSGIHKYILKKLSKMIFTCQSAGVPYKYPAFFFGVNKISWMKVAQK